MEEKTVLNEVLHILAMHSEKIDKRFDRLEKKFDGVRVELTETQETTDFLMTKSIQHEKKIREMDIQLSSTP